MDAGTDIMLTSERGASAVLIAFGMVVLLGVAAVALDISAAFNERNQNQNAGDNGVMAGAMEKADQNPDTAIVNNALDLVRANLTADFTGPNDPNWIAMWQNCVDAGNPNWVPLPQPAAWGGGTLDCISQTTSLLRIRIPDQLLATTFGRAIGASSLTTNAVSIAKVRLQNAPPPVVPFGVAASAGAGEECLSSASNGTAYSPCDGSNSGAFGPFISPLFGDFGTHEPLCTGNKGTMLVRNVVHGIDHQIHEWPHAVAPPPVNPWPGPNNNVLNGLADTNQDACSLDPDGNVTPAAGIDINTVEIQSGLPNPALTDAFVSDVITDGLPSRLQQGSNPTRTIISKVGGIDQNWDLDNVGLWKYLTDTSSEPTCKESHYTSLPDTAARLAAIDYCLNNIPLGEVIFDASITTSPRFVWVPRFAYELPGTTYSPGGGVSWMPILRFEAGFIAGTWFNCSGSICGLEFYPDETETTAICAPAGPGCKSLTLDQFSTWLIPSDGLPQSVFDDFDSAFENLEAELYQ